MNIESMLKIVLYIKIKMLVPKVRFLVQKLFSPPAIRRNGKRLRLIMTRHFLIKLILEIIFKID